MPKYIGTKFKGVRAREHATRKHGIKPDLYFFIRYQFQGTRKEEGLGWASEGWTAEKAALKLAELKNAARTGEGDSRLSEKRETKKQNDLLIQRQKQERTKKKISYNRYFRDHYLEDAKQSKSKSAVEREWSLHKNWILPAIGATPIAKIGELHVKKVSLVMKKGGRAPRTIQYAHAAIRMVINHGIKSGYYHNINPIKHLSVTDKPKFDNKRLRFFSPSEAENLLKILQTKSRDTHDITLLSLHCGLRAGEIFRLTWENVDFKNRLINVVQTKTSKDRTVPMTGAVKNTLHLRANNSIIGLVFPNRNGKQRTQISKTFDRTVRQLGLNENVENRKNKIVFHSCRHTCASWLVQAGATLLTVKEIMGHSTIAMTERYSHLAPDGTKAAMAIMEKSIISHIEAASEHLPTTLTNG